MSLSSDEMRRLYQRTVIVKKPTYGIIKGYHELPYVCIGPSFEDGNQSTLVKGKIQISEQMLLRPSQYLPSYEDIFGEDNVNLEISGRLFGFLGFKGRPVECKSEFLELTHLNKSIDQVLSESLDDIERREDISTGVIISPDSRYYPVSIERFIASILDDEFSF